MNDIVSLATMYVGGEPCSEDLEVLKKVARRRSGRQAELDLDGLRRDRAAVERRLGGIGELERIVHAGPSAKPGDVAYGYPKEGYPLWMDSVMLLKDAQNVEEAYKFLDFIMQAGKRRDDLELCALCQRHSGSEAFMDPEHGQTAPEVVIPEEFKAAGVFYADLQRQVARIHDRDLDRVAEVSPDQCRGGTFHFMARAFARAGGFTPPAPPWDIWRRESHAGMVGHRAVARSMRAKSRRPR
jgi:hypothetical protein